MHSPLFLALRAVVLLALRAPHPTAEQAVVADTIASVVEEDGDAAPLTTSHAEDAALIGVYARLESGASEHPTPASWDSRAGVSCGALQMPCWFVRKHPLEEQVRTWIRWAREGGLAALDSSPRRAAERERVAREVLAGILR